MCARILTGPTVQVEGPKSGGSSDKSTQTWTDTAHQRRPEPRFGRQGRRRSTVTRRAHSVEHFT
jgi:hypothetical protein